MKSRLVTVYAVLLLAGMLLPGCPVSSPLVGTWQYSDSSPFDILITLAPDGTATSSPVDGSPSMLVGTLTWEVDGSAFVMKQDTGDNQIIYAGRVTNNNAITGAFIVWDGTVVGQNDTWSAIKL